MVDFHYEYGFNEDPTYLEVPPSISSNVRLEGQSHLLILPIKGN